jgi:dTDP-glucose 4,6-dehydratase
METILVTGGAGFIGSNFILSWIASRSGRVINLDKLTYAGNPANLAELEGSGRHVLVQGDVGDGELVKRLLNDHRPAAIVHFAAESHVDRSIRAPQDFITTNVVGTSVLLNRALQYWESLNETEQSKFRFLHISTDEVFGSLTANDMPFSETTRYAPNSPYAASKAASDHLVRAFHRTYGLPAIISNCSNNYGPYQFPEKFISLLINNARLQKPLPIYGDGKNVRDWLYVQDHCRALQLLLEQGRVGESYNIGGGHQATNIEIAEHICAIFDEIQPAAAPHRRLIHFVADRPGHDRRYAIDASKIMRELGWRPVESFSTGIRKTVEWYLQHTDWIDNVTSGAYREWMKLHYAQV